jgi:poly(3-hydroxybutyrate) depolymerase
MPTALQVLQADNVRSRGYAIVQSRPQEHDYQWSYIIRVPERVQGKMPVVFFLHGNGGSAEEALNSSLIEVLLKQS